MVRRALTGLIAAAALAGCGPAGRAPAVVEEGAPLGPAQVRELADAEEILVARCMRGQGFEYHRGPADPARRPP
jgi:hypothetical protein